MGKQRESLSNSGDKGVPDNNNCTLDSHKEDAHTSRKQRSVSYQPMLPDRQRKTYTREKPFRLNLQKKASSDQKLKGNLRMVNLLMKEAQQRRF